MDSEIPVDGLWGHYYHQHDFYSVQYNSVTKYVLVYLSTLQLDERRWA